MLLKKNTSFNTILREAKTDIRMGDKKIELLQLLEAPMNHIILYRPIFRDLIARTLKDLGHPDHKHLELVIGQIDAVFLLIAQKKRFTELDQKIKKNKNLESLISVDRRLLKEGFLIIGPKKKRMYVILCSDIMLITNADKKGILNIVNIFYLDKIQVKQTSVVDAKSPSQGFNFEIYDENNKVTVVAHDSEHELNDWFNIILSSLIKTNTK